ncbi:hypothetical protein VTK56DRAFT_8958 [Thermocarpiscus australiensis]
MRQVNLSHHSGDFEAVRNYLYCVHTEAGFEAGLNLLWAVSAVFAAAFRCGAQKPWVTDASTFDETKFGADYPSTLTSIVNLASTYRKRGRWEEAKKLAVMAGLASMYGNQGRWEEAEELEAQVMETSKTKLGPDGPNTLTNTANLASTYWSQDW